MKSCRFASQVAASQILRAEDYYSIIPKNKSAMDYNIAFEEAAAQFFLEKTIDGFKILIKDMKENQKNVYPNVFRSEFTTTTFGDITFDARLIIEFCGNEVSKATVKLKKANSSCKSTITKSEWDTAIWTLCELKVTGERYKAIQTFQKMLGQLETF